MPILTKKTAAYGATTVFVKKGGAYVAAALLGVFVKVSGAYKSAWLAYSAFTAEVGTAATASALRVAMTNTRRQMVLIDNPSSNAQTMEYALSVQANNSRNPPSTGWIAVAPGVRNTITADDATKQIYVRVASSSTKAVTAASCSGTTATLTVPGHGIAVGALAVRAFESITPSGYNIRNVLVTATDANTVTCALLATQTAGTAFGYMYDASECIAVTAGELPQ